MDFLDSVRQVFDAQGPLAKVSDSFRPREGQIRMADAVAKTLQSGGVLVAEAGTGVGKTYAYLVPALLSGQRVLVSTATKTLQDQLFNRDIPRLLKALALPIRVALLKGRSSYLCLHRLEGARQDPSAMDLDAMRQLARIEQWALMTRSGDLVELDSLDERSPLIPLVTSTRENCLGAQCAKADKCHVNLARKEAIQADMVVINHHLFFADLNVRESGIAELLPSANCVVFDEAHQLNDIGVQFLGKQLSTGQLRTFGRDLVAQTQKWARGLANWHLLAMDLNRAIDALRGAGGATKIASSRRWADKGPQGIPLTQWTTIMGAIHQSLGDAVRALGPVAEISPDLNKLVQRGLELMGLIESYASAVPPGSVRWLELGAQVRLIESPVGIAEAMRSKVLRQGEQAGSQKSWIFTSATLGTDASLSLFVEACGLQGAQLLQVESPFDFAAQAGLFIPPHLPVPSDARHSASVAQLAAQGASILGGRTLVLTTTLRAMHAIGDALLQHFRGPGALQVLVQGEASKRELVERFGNAGGTASAGCILVASASFWEGVDMPGDALQLLVIDKLPFAPPDDPLVEARALQTEQKGGNAFRHFHLPQATLALKQGVGRLIRSETDRGVVVICDTRLAQMGYGKKIVKALPNMQCIGTHEEFLSTLRGFTKTSTTDPVVRL